MTIYHRVFLGFGAVVVVGWILVVLFADRLMAYPPGMILLPLTEPGTASPDGGVLWLGSDHLGRDTFSRLLLAAKLNFFAVCFSLGCVYVLGLPIAWAANAKAWPVTAAANGIVAIARAIPPFVAYVVVITSWYVGALPAFSIAALLVSLPGLVQAWSDLRQSQEQSGDGKVASRVLLIWSIDGLRRAALLSAIIETFQFFKLGPWLASPLFDNFRPATFGGMVGETWAFVRFLPSLPLSPIGALCLILFGLHRFAAGLEGLLLPGHRGREPAAPTFRPGR